MMEVMTSHRFNEQSPGYVPGTVPGTRKSQTKISAHTDLYSVEERQGKANYTEH